MNRSDFITSIRDWLDREDFSEALIGSWITMALNQLSTELRIDRMVTISEAQIDVDRCRLPEDWQEADFVRVVGEAPLTYVSRDEFYNMNSTRDYLHYTISGRFLIIGGDPPSLASPRQVELSYFADIPDIVESPSGPTENWILEHYLNLFTMCTLAYASAYGIEDERAAGFASTVSAMVGNLNDQYKASKTSGSRLNRQNKRKKF